MRLGDLFTVVRSCGRFGGPFLLEEGSGNEVGLAQALQVIQVVFAPGLADFLISLARQAIVIEKKKNSNVPPWPRE